jgi:putative ATP-dependent endonuclease of the OLD family
MRIARLELRNFRGIENGSIDLPQHGALLGPNNVGKTAVTDSLALLFGRERVSYQLCDWDFFGGHPEPHTRFTIICTITEFGSDNPNEHPNWFAGESAAHPIWWSPAKREITFEPGCPDGSSLAAQIALSARYNEEDCEIETLRYFYHGESDPFTDGCHIASQHRIHELGLFIIPANRQWDRLLSFGSSSFLKALRQSDAVPGSAIEHLKNELRAPNTTIEDSPKLKPLLASAEEELRRFLMLEVGGKLVYRPTSLDTLGVLQSLLPHVTDEEGMLLPLARHGAGMVSLQSFLIVLAFAEQRRSAGKNFILIAEEPELHLHPSLHRRLANRIRAVSTQSLITTHSPLVAATYKPNESIFLRNSKGKLTAEAIKAEPLKSIISNSIRKLYVQKREAFYDAIMGGGILVPEGDYDYDWLRQIQKLAESSEESSYNVMPLSIVPTADAAIVATYVEVARLRPDAVPILDGDNSGAEYLDGLGKLGTRPISAIQLGPGAATELLAAWILEPALKNSGPTLTQLLPNSCDHHLRALQLALCLPANKKDRNLHENLASEATQEPECVIRAAAFLRDISAVVSGKDPKGVGWRKWIHSSGIVVYVAEHISKEQECSSQSSSPEKQVPAKLGN